MRVFFYKDVLVNSLTNNITNEKGSCLRQSFLQIHAVTGQKAYLVDSVRGTTTRGSHVGRRSFQYHFTKTDPVGHLLVRLFEGAESAPR